MTTDAQQLHAIVHGQVQGVNFRYSTQAQASRLAEELPPSCIMRSASLRAVSMYISSFRSARACKGVELVSACQAGCRGRRM